MWPESEWQKKNGGRLVGLVKAKTPAPGDFHFQKPEDAYKSTQLPPETFNFAREKRVAVTEAAAQKKRYIPGAGHYKFDSNTLTKISGSPRSVAVKRH